MSALDIAMAGLTLGGHGVTITIHDSLVCVTIVDGDDALGFGYSPDDARSIGRLLMRAADTLDEGWAPLTPAATTSPASPETDATTPESQA